MKREGDYIKHPPPTLYNVESFSFVNIFLLELLSMSTLLVSLLSLSLSLSLSHTHTHISSLPLHRMYHDSLHFPTILKDIKCLRLAAILHIMLMQQSTLMHNVVGLACRATYIFTNIFVGSFHFHSLMYYHGRI